MYPFVSRHKMALPHEELLRLQNELKREREKNAALQKEVAILKNSPRASLPRDETAVPFEEHAEKVALTYRCAQLENELKALKEQSVLNFSRSEAEEEGLINRLVKRLNDLKKEKETLAIEVEREEELLTNTLQKRLTAALREKGTLEQQLGKVKSEKEALALEVEREEELLTNTLQKKLDTLRKEKEQLEVRLCMEQRRSPTSQMYGQQPVMGEARENLDTILRDSEGQVLVQKLKDALGAIKTRHSTPHIQQGEMDTLMQISQRIDRLVELTTGPKQQPSPVQQRSQRLPSL